MLGKGLQLKTSALLVFFLWLVKSLKNVEIIGWFFTWRNVAFFSDFRYGFRSSRSTEDLIVESDRIASGFNSLLELSHLIYPRLLTGFGMVVFFTNLSLLEF